MATIPEPVAASPARPPVARWLTGGFARHQWPPLSLLLHTARVSLTTGTFRFPRCLTTVRETSPAIISVPPYSAAHRRATTRAFRAGRSSWLPARRRQASPSADTQSTGVRTIPVPRGRRFLPTATYPPPVRATAST